MIKWLLCFVALFVLGLFSSSLTLGNEGKDCKNVDECPGNSCGKDNNGHFARCVDIPLPTVTLPTITLPTTSTETTVTVPSVPIPITTDKVPSTTTATQPGTTTLPSTTTQPATTTQSQLPPPAFKVPRLRGLDNENELRTAGVNFGFSIVGFIFGLAAAWAWGLRGHK